MNKKPVMFRLVCAIIIIACRAMLTGIGRARVVRIGNRYLKADKQSDTQREPVAGWYIEPEQ